MVGWFARRAAHTFNIVSPKPRRDARDAILEGLDVSRAMVRLSGSVQRVDLF
jgi:hypothetical protein